jgi:cell division protein DivIC
MVTDYSRPQHPTAEKGRRRRMRTALLLASAVLIWFGVKWYEQHGVVSAKLEELVQLEQQLEATKQLNEQYRMEIARMEDPEYIEQLLRKELHMTKDGEKLFIKTD